MERDNINYKLIDTAHKIYSELGYIKIKTPWVVSKKAINITLPSACKSFDTSYGSLVGSGEQGFIEMMLNGKLKYGQYQTITPCFRDEEEYDNIHLMSFIKIELIMYLEPSIGLDVLDFYKNFNTVNSYVEKITNDALLVFDILSNNRLIFEKVRENNGYDINLNNIEIGSYGFRCFENHFWIFGTGLAEPRFSISSAINEKIY